MLGKYDDGNPAALRELVAGGTKLLPFPTRSSRPASTPTNEIYDEISAKNPKFKKVYDTGSPTAPSRSCGRAIAEGGFDNFMARMSAADKV